MHSVSVTPIYQPCEQGVSSFCFLSFLGFFGFFLVVVGGGESDAKGKRGESMSFDLRYFPLSYLLHYSICSSLSTNPVFLQLTVFLSLQDVP